jgi:superfamily II DNA or RNA helicase
LYIITKKNVLELPFVNDKIENEILQYFTILNPKWIDNKKRNRWNGKTPKYLYHYEYLDNPNFEDEKLLVPRGSLDCVISFYKKKSVDIKVKDETKNYDDIDFCFQGQLRDYQKKAVRIMLKKNDGVLESFPGSGKTVMAINLIAIRKQPFLVVVHTTELLHQWMDRLGNFLSIPKKEIGIIGNGKKKSKPKANVALVQTLSKVKMPLVGHLVVDECHRIPSSTFTNIVKRFEGKYLLGLSATPYRNDCLTQLINWYAGEIRYTVPTEKLQNMGSIVKIKPIIRQTPFRSSFENPASNYPELIKELTENEVRNRFIVNDILNLPNDSKSTCLVLSDRKNHCNCLYNMLKERDSSLKIEILNTDKSSKQRKQIVKRVGENKINILIATSQLIGEGFDCSNLSILFLTTPVKALGRIIQYAGRVLRPAKGKKKAIIYDYFDSNILCLHNSFKSRQKAYEKLV